MEASVLLQFSGFFVFLITFYQSLEPCNAAKEVRPFQKSCNETIDCGTNHVIAIVNVIPRKPFVKNRCNGQHKCQLFRIYQYCFVSYYCIDDRFNQKNCSSMESPVNIENSEDLFWCYINTGQKRGPRKCWKFENDVYHHWIVLRGTMSVDGIPMPNFKIIESSNNSQVCASSNYKWIIYLGTKSSKTVVNIYSKTDPTLTVPDEIAVAKKNDSNVEVTKPEPERNNSSTKDPKQYFFLGDDNDETNKNDTKNEIAFLRIIIIIGVIGGVLIVLAVIIAILCCCCRRCNKVATTKTVPVESRKDSCHVNDSQSVNDPLRYPKSVEVKVEESNCQIREGFIATDAIRDTCDSVDFWSDEEDYDANNDHHSKIKPHPYAMGNCIYERNSSRNDIYMNAVIPPPSRFENNKNDYINMNANHKKVF